MIMNKANWKYVIGEILIVSVGILIAFVINNWSLKLKKANTYQEYKNSLIVDLEQNLENLNRIIIAQELKVKELNQVIIAIEKSNNYDIDSIGMILFRQRKSPTFFPVKGTFKALVSHGEIELFDTQLKREIFNLYDTNYERTVYNGNLYDEIYISTYDTRIQDIINLRTQKVSDPERLNSADFAKDIMIIVDEAESYLRLIYNTRTKSTDVLKLVRKS